MEQQPTSTQQGPAKGALHAASRIVTILVGMVETRLRLAVVELEEEKANLIQMLLMAGITLLFLAFGLMSLLLGIFWTIDPAYRLQALWITSGVLLLLALIGLLWTMAKAKRTSFLLGTRKQLEVDRALLEKERE